MRVFYQMVCVVFCILITSSCWAIDANMACGVDLTGVTTALANGDANSADEIFFGAIEEVRAKKDPLGQAMIDLRVSDCYREFFQRIDDKQSYDYGVDVCTQSLERESVDLHDFRSSHLLCLSARAGFLMKKGEYEKAKIDYEKAIEIGSGYWRTYGELALFLSICPDDKFRNGKAAIELLEKAITEGELTKEEQLKNHYYLNILAAAYAESGEFSEAVKTQQSALDILQEKSQKMAKRIGDTIANTNVITINEYRMGLYMDRLADYQENKPWRIETP